MLYVLSLLLSRSGIQAMLSPSTEILFLLGASGALPVVAYGRWWTLLTAGWLHGGVLHIFFNVLWIRQLAPAVADLYGPARMVDHLHDLRRDRIRAQHARRRLPGEPPFFFRGAGFTVGASASIFGLLGAAGLSTGGAPAAATSSQAGLQYALFMGIFGLIFPGVDNYAHAGGFAGGYLVGVLLDPLKPERVDHIVMAVVCLLATAIALGASIVTALPLLLA